MLYNYLMQSPYPLSPQLPTSSLFQLSPITSLHVFFSHFSAETAWQLGCTIHGLFPLSFEVDWWLFSIDY